MKTAINIPDKPTHVGESLMTHYRPATDFVRGMSHDLRTPLTVIIGMCRLLELDRNAPLLPMQHDAVNRIDRNARALLETVNRLLECLRTGQFE